MSSTRGCTVAGLKKCIPRTCSGRAVAVAISPIEIDDVFDARMPDGCTMRSRVAKTCALTSGASMTASMTRSRSASSSNDVEKRRRPSMALRSSSLSLPRLTALAVLDSRRCWATSAKAASTSTTMVSHPLRAATSAMPDPIVPPPITATFSIAIVVVVLSDGTRYRNAATIVEGFAFARVGRFGRESLRATPRGLAAADAAARAPRSTDATTERRDPGGSGPPETPLPQQAAAHGGTTRPPRSAPRCAAPDTGWRRAPRHGTPRSRRSRRRAGPETVSHPLRILVP